MSAIFGLVFLFHSDYIKDIIPGWIHNKWFSDLHKNKQNIKKAVFPTWRYLAVDKKCTLKARDMSLPADTACFEM